GAGGGGGGGAGSRRSPVGASAWLPAAVPGLPTLGRTFDGRDRFAPLAARLTDAAVEARWKLTWRRRVPGEGATHDLLPAQQPDGHWRGGFLHFDHFGNGITNFSLAGWQPDRALFEGGKPVWKVRWNGWDLRLCRSYAGAGAGAGAEAAERAGTGTGRRSGARGSNRPVALVGSTGLLELAIPGGSFAGRFARELARPGGGVIRLVPHARG
ncbi:MAG: SAM hydroxide adenosyltransferase, partial [Planctomycetota bacterium]